jgi:mono/diheme cytochrome c family protein
MKTTSSVLCLLGFTMLAGAYSAVLAQAPESALGGVYTTDQAKRGEKVYADSCATCHGPKLLGTDAGGPPIGDKDFIGGWKDMSVGALLNKISTDMPSNAPGTLTPEQYADVAAYVLSVNRYPAGMTELPTDAAALKTVKMGTPPAAPAAARRAPAPKK